MRGRPLKQDPQDGGARRQFEFTELGSDPVEGTPDLPKIPGRRWLKRTREWYEAWRSSPMASQFIGTDWEALFRLAALVDDFWRGDASKAGEIRQMEGKFGATIDDRMRLRLRVQTRGVKAEQDAGEQPAKRRRGERPDPRLRVVGESSKTGS